MERELNEAIKELEREILPYFKAPEIDPGDCEDFPLMCSIIRRWSKKYFQVYSNEFVMTQAEKAGARLDLHKYKRERSLYDLGKSVVEDCALKEIRDPTEEMPFERTRNTIIVFKKTEL